MKGSKALSAAVRGPHHPPVPLACRSSNAFAKRNNTAGSNVRSGTNASLRPSPPKCLAQRAPRFSFTQCRNSSDEASLKDGGLNQTAFHEIHVNHGGKMVSFGGFSMPVQYTDLSVGDSHKWTREKASLFDVGHMYVSHSL